MAQTIVFCRLRLFATWQATKTDGPPYGRVIVGRTPTSARDPLVALFLPLPSLTPDTTLGNHDFGRVGRQQLTLVAIFRGDHLENALKLRQS